MASANVYRVKVLMPDERNMDRELVYVKDTTDVQMLLAQASPPRKVTLVLSKSIVGSEQIERQINRELSSCGCGEATAAMLVTFATSSVFAIFGLREWSWLARFILVFAATAVAMVVGKVIAKAIARRRYLTLLRRLVVSLQE